MIGDIHVLEYNPDDDTMQDLYTGNSGNKALIDELNNLLKCGTASKDYYEVFSQNNLLVSEYYNYLMTAPIDVNLELERLNGADLELCYALMTMLFRQDHFDNGSFEKHIKDGSAASVVRRIIKLLSYS